jgi:hypothetical protein
MWITKIITLELYSPTKGAIPNMEFSLQSWQLRPTEPEKRVNCTTSISLKNLHVILCFSMNRIRKYNPETAA